MPQLIYDYRTWKRGASSSPFSSDGGFSPDTIGVDMISVPGVLYPGISINSAHGNDISTHVLSGETVIACAQKEVLADHDVVYVTANGSKDGRLEKITSAATMTTLAAIDTAHDYEEGVTDVLEFHGNIYWTSNTEIAKDGDYDWLSTIGSAGHNLTVGVPHMMCIYEDTLYITDGRFIHTYDGSTFTWQALDFPIGFVTTAIESHSGYVYFAAERVSSNLSGDVTGETKIIIWDGIDSNTFNDDIPINRHVSAMKSHMGRLYVFTSTGMCEFRASELIEIFPLKAQVRKHQVTVVASKIFFVYKNPTFPKIACFAQPDVNSPPCVMFPISFDYFDATTAVMALAPCDISSSTGIRAFYRQSSTIVKLNNAFFPQTPSSFIQGPNGGLNLTEHVENPFFFQMLVKLNKIKVIFDGLRNSRCDYTFYFLTGSTPVTLFTINDDTAAQVYEKALGDISQMDMLQLRHYFTLDSDGAVVGIAQIIIDYDPVEGIRSK